MVVRKLGFCRLPIAVTRVKGKKGYIIVCVLLLRAAVSAALPE